jgi:hypothetical protein
MSWPLVLREDVNMTALTITLMAAATYLMMEII